MKARARPPSRIGRSVALFALVVVMISAWLYSRVRAQNAERMLRMGAQLATVTSAEGARDVELNGARVQLTAASTEAEVSDVLDRAYASCLDEGIDVGALAGPGERRGVTPGLLDPAMRWDGGTEGFVGCLGARAGAVAWERFRSTGDLADVGGFRYLYAVRRGDRTQLVSVRSEGAFALGTMFPARGDAPGFDIEGVPRPEGARRTLAVRELGRLQSMTVHRGSSEGALRRHYLERLPAEGWRVRDVRGALHAERADASLTLSFGEGDRGAWVSALHEGAR